MSCATGDFDTLGRAIPSCEVGSGQFNPWFTVGVIVWIVGWILIGLWCDR